MMKIDPISVAAGFGLALLIVEAKKIMDGRKEGFCGCAAAV